MIEEESAYPVRRLSLIQRIFSACETYLLTRMVPEERPGPVFRWLFKVPILLYRLGLGRLIGGRIMLLTTRGRHTGKRRDTPLEYSYDSESDTYWVMAGWRGQTDWYRNARAYTRVHVQVGARSFEAEAQTIPEDETAVLMLDLTRQFPGLLKIYSRWAGFPVQATQASMRAAAGNFPCLRLVPRR